jgi:ABC-type glycerol-3-phosphate transport system substrate-binding protein
VDCEPARRGINTEETHDAHRRHTMKNRPLALAVGVLMSVTGLTACTSSSGESEPEITLELMTWHGPDATTKYYDGYQEIADNYMEDHPEVEIKIKSEEDAAYGSVLETGFAGGTAPDIIQMKSGQRSTYATNLLDLREYLSAPSAYAEGEGAWMDTFVGGAEAFPPEDNGEAANALLFVPNDGNPEVFAGSMYLFNNKLIEDAGLDPETTPVTWKEMFEWLEALSGDSEVAPIAGSTDVGLKVSQIGYGFGEHYADKFFDQKFADPEFSGELYTDKLYVLANYDKGSEMPLTDLPYYPAMFKLMKQHLSYYQESWTENSPETEVLTFASGRAAMMQTTFWDYGTLTASLSESSFPDGYGLFQLPYFGADTLDYAVEQGWITADEAEAAAPYAVDRPANVGGAGKHEYGFSVNKATAEDPERLEATLDFLQYLSSKDVQTQYVETAQSLSPVNGVEIIDALTPFIVEEPEGGYAEEVLGYTVVEWGKAGWDVSVNKFLAGEISWEEMVKEVAAPEWAADIPPPPALADGVATAQADLKKAKKAEKPDKEHALGFAQLRADLYNTYYHEATGDLVEQR